MGVYWYLLWVTQWFSIVKGLGSWPELFQQERKMVRNTNRHHMTWHVWLLWEGGWVGRERVTERDRGWKKELGGMREKVVKEDKLLGTGETVWNLMLPKAFETSFSCFAWKPTATCVIFSQQIQEHIPGLHPMLSSKCLWYLLYFHSSVRKNSLINSDLFLYL